MRLYGISTHAGPFDGNIVGTWHYLTAGASVFVVCEPEDRDTAEAYLMAQGVTVFPDLLDTATPVGAQLSTLLPAISATAGVSASDSSYQALKKLHASLKWPMLNPHLGR